MPMIRPYFFADRWQFSIMNLTLDCSVGLSIRVILQLFETFEIRLRACRPVVYMYVYITQ